MLDIISGRTLEQAGSSLPLRQEIAGKFKKENFSNRVGLLPLPDSVDPSFPDKAMVHHVYAVNKATDEKMMAALESDDPAVYSPAMNYLKKLSRQAQEYLDSLQVNRSLLESPENQQVLAQIRQRYETADRHWLSLDGESLSPHQKQIDRLAMRLAYSEGIQFGLDVDKTLSVGDDYLKDIPGSRQAENLMDTQSREIFPLMLARYWGDALTHLHEVFFRIGERIPTREGVNDFFNLTLELDIPLTIMSAQFEPIVAGFLNQINNKQHVVKFNTVTPRDISATDKSRVAAQAVLDAPDLALLVCADGLTDRGFISGQAKGIVAAGFALEGGGFDKELAQNGIPFFTFKDFFDVASTLKSVLVRRDELKQELLS